MCAHVSAQRLRKEIPIEYTLNRVRTNLKLAEAMAPSKTSRSSREVKEMDLTGTAMLNYLITNNVVVMISRSLELSLSLSIYI